LELEEPAIIEAVGQWAKHQCEKQELKETKENIQNVAKHVVLLLRIPTISLEELALFVTPTNLLNTSALNQLFKYLAFKSADDAEDERKVRPAGWETSEEGIREIALLRADRSKRYPSIPYPIIPRKCAGNYDVSWMETGDSYKGLRGLPGPSGESKFFLAVSRANTFDRDKKYGLPRGYEWAKSEMWNAQTVLTSSTDYNYYNQGGWSSYDWAGVTRHCFFFQDTLQRRKAIHAGNYATMGGFQDWAEGNGTFFAGLVLVKKRSYNPSTKLFVPVSK